MRNSNSKKKEKKRDEVEELLAAAEEEMVLKMSLNSHMARASSSQFIDPHLDRRFQALKSSKPLNTHAKNITNHPLKATPPANEKANYEDGGDDLFARFAALKNSLPSHNQRQVQDHVVVDDDDDDEEDEVDKVIKWAKDAARLDPSPPSDTDQDADDDDDDDDDDDEDEDDDRVKKGKKGKGR